MKAIVLSLLGFIACWPATAQTPVQKSFAQQLVRDEPAIKDALWMTANNLYVGVIDNGSRRDGFASYVCHDAKPMGAKMVKVIDIAKLKQTGKFVEIGTARCQ